MDGLDRFAVLRDAFPPADWTDDEINALLERSCELHLTHGHVLIEDGEPRAEWFVVLDGRVEIREQSGRRWLAVAGSVIDAPGDRRWTVGATALQGCVVLAITAALDEWPERPNDR